MIFEMALDISNLTKKRTSIGTCPRLQTNPLQPEGLDYIQHTPRAGNAVPNIDPLPGLFFD